MSNQQFPFGLFFSSETEEKKEPALENPSPEKEDLPLVEPSREEDHEVVQDEHLKLLNQEIHQQLKKALGPQKYAAYFQEVLLLKQVAPKLIEFSISSQFLKNVIEKIFMEELKRIILQVLGKDYDVHLTLLSENTSPLPEKSGKSNAKEASFTLDFIFNQPHEQKGSNSTLREQSTARPSLNHHTGILLDTHKTFENFIIGPSNHMAYASIQAMTKGPGRIYPSIFLHGNSGLGKTHLMHAAANKIKEEFPQLRIYFVSARDFMNEMINAMANKDILSFRKKYSERVDVLLVDDIHELKNKSGTQNEFFHIFNELHSKNKQLIFTSDRPPQEIDGLEDRLRTRLSWGLVLDVQAPDLETRMAILKKKAEQEDLFISEDVINYIAQQVKHSIRELEGSLIKLSAYASVMQTDIDLEVAKKQLALESPHHQHTSPEKDFFPLEKILQVVSEKLNVPIPDIKSKIRIKSIALARHLGIYLSYHYSPFTLEQIGLFYGLKDHSSALHAVEKIRQEAKKNTDFAQKIKELEIKMSEIFPKRR